MSDPGATISEAVRLATAGSEIGGLRRRFALAISLLVALVLAAQGAVLVHFGGRHLRREIEERAASYATLAVGPVCAAYQTYSGSGFSKFRELVLEIAALNPDLERLEMYDVEGRLLFRSDELSGARGGARPGAAAASAPVADERLGEALRGLEQVVWTAEDAAGEERYVVAAPWVEEWGRHRYSVAFLFSYHGLEKARRGVAWQIGGLALLALAAGVGFAFLLAGQILGPVTRLTQGARRLADGDLDHRIELRTGDELEVLGATFDQMAGRLRSTVEDLETSNERLGRLNEELRQIDRVKSDLLANVSHELRTPLTAIGGYVEAMREGLLGEIDELQGRSLEVMERNVERLRGMIDQLLSYSRMVSGGLDVELAVFDLEVVARQVMEAVRAGRPRSEELELVCDCPPDLPEVYGDDARIGQVIENLLTNAVKFSPHEERIELGIRRVEEEVEVAVSDQGIGIPEDLQEKIFDRFYQVDASSKRHFGGIGLGLAIVRQILELNSSEIRVESRPGAGSTFRFILPLAAERSARVETRRGEEAARPRVAVIDDDAGFVRQVAAHLSGRGFTVDTAATVEQGFALVRRVVPVVVILDRLLPDGDGFDLLARLRRHPTTEKIPVVLATVRAEKALGLRLGAAAYLRKPLDPEDLEATLRRILASGDGEETGVGGATPGQE